MSTHQSIDPADFCRSVAAEVARLRNVSATATASDTAEDAVNAAFSAHGILGTDDCPEWEELAIIGTQHALELLGEVSP